MSPGLTALADINKQNDQGNHKPEQAGCFGQGKAQQQIGKLALCRGWIAQGARQVIAENMTNANTSANKCD